jgi:hypothetical protein
MLSEISTFSGGTIKAAEMIRNLIDMGLQQAQKEQS